MKRYILLLLTFVTILCTGCGAKQTEITNEENNMIAEYMAGVLLKYDMKYEAKLLYAAQQKTPNEAEPETTLPPTTKPGSVDNETKIPEVTATPKPIYQSIAKIYKEYGGKVSFLEAKEYKSYPKTLENGYFLQEEKNNKLLVLSFRIENTDKSSNNFCLIGEGITYGLKNGQDKTKKPLLTALTNDLQYLDIKIDAGKKEEAVLVFRIPKNHDISDYTLYITKNNKTAEVKLV